uniref:Uncharacterized protein n=1 Tax=Anguilla anguilla TaxID=7936 RepID=A0A0E9PCT4_ANGAN
MHSFSSQSQPVDVGRPFYMERIVKKILLFWLCSSISACFYLLLSILILIMFVHSESV